METLPWLILGGLSGLVAGSFLATLVVRWPEGRGLGGRSMCDHCGRRLGVFELVPLLSWALAHGRCRSCGGTIDARHPIIELTAAAIGMLAMAAAPGPQGLAGAVMGWALLALIALDTAHHWLPDRLTLPLLGAGLVLGPGILADRLLGAAIAGGGLLALALGYRALRGRDGLGLGDVKLGAALGAWLGPLLLGPLLLLAAVIGLLLVGLGALRGRPVSSTDAVPFGACMAAAAFPLWLFAAATAWA